MRDYLYRAGPSVEKRIFKNKILLRKVPSHSDRIANVTTSVPLRKNPSSQKAWTRPHPDDNWTPENHYGYCGLNCPCCRFRVEGPNGFGVCLHCAGPVVKLPIGPVQILKSATDEHNYPMHLVKGSMPDLPPNVKMAYVGWIYEKNLKIETNYIYPAMAKNDEVEILARAKDENNIAMFQVKSANNVIGWTYPKNFLSPDDCPICMNPIGKKNLFTCKCSHQFHKSCIEQWLSQGNVTCPVCRAPNTCG